MKRAFTILEATIGALMLSCLIAVFADYFVSRTTKARDSEMRTTLYSLTQSCNNALSNAYATAMQSRMQKLVRHNGSISDFTLELPTGTMQDCYAVVRSAFRDYVYYNSTNSEVADPFNRAYTGAKPIDGSAGLLAIPEGLYVNIQYIVQKPNESAVVPDFAATKSSQNPSYVWRFEYRGASTVSFTLYHTLVVTIFTDKDGLDFRAGMPALANYIKEGVINAANVVFTLHTQCEAEGFNMDGFEPMATSGTISSPFSTNLLARFADNPLVDDEQPEVPDVPDLRFAKAGFDDLTLAVSFNQGSTPDTNPSGSITLKDLDLRQDITLEEGESVEWSISGSSAVIRGNGTSADIVFSGINYASLAAGNHDFVETVTAKIIKDGKVVKTITGKVKLSSSIAAPKKSKISNLFLSLSYDCNYIHSNYRYPGLDVDPIRYTFYDVLTLGGSTRMLLSYNKNQLNFLEIYKVLLTVTQPELFNPGDLVQITGDVVFDPGSYIKSYKYTSVSEMETNVLRGHNYGKIILTEYGNSVILFTISSRYGKVESKDSNVVGVSLYLSLFYPKQSFSFARQEDADKYARLIDSNAK